MGLTNKNQQKYSINQNQNLWNKIYKTITQFFKKNKHFSHTHNHQQKKHLKNNLKSFYAIKIMITKKIKCQPDVPHIPATTIAQKVTNWPTKSFSKKKNIKKKKFMMFLVNDKSKAFNLIKAICVYVCMSVSILWVCEVRIQIPRWWLWWWLKIMKKV